MQMPEQILPFTHCPDLHQILTQKIGDPLHVFICFECSIHMSCTVQDLYGNILFTGYLHRLVLKPPRLVHRADIVSISMLKQNRRYIF